MIPESKWEWFGYAGHLIVGHMCRFHLCTKVGKYLISTVGDYRSSLDKEDDKPREIGCNRLYETMVFLAGKRCVVEHCRCGQPSLKTASEIDFAGYNVAGDAQRGHMKMCRKYARKP
jgi:hypothetical protein